MLLKIRLKRPIVSLIGTHQLALFSHNSKTYSPSDQTVFEGCSQNAIPNIRNLRHDCRVDCGVHNLDESLSREDSAICCFVKHWTVVAPKRWSHMKRIFAVVVVLLVFQAVDGKPLPKDIPKSDITILQGDWERIAMEVSGKEVTYASQYVLTIKADKWYMRTVNDGREPTWISFKVDAAKKPKEIDLIYPDRAAIKGIYKVEGDILIMCHMVEAESRPTEFTIGNGEIRYVCKRSKK